MLYIRLLILFLASPAIVAASISTALFNRGIFGNNYNCFRCRFLFIFILMVESVVLGSLFEEENAHQNRWGDFRLNHNCIEKVKKVR